MKLRKIADGFSFVFFTVLLVLGILIIAMRILGFNFFAIETGSMGTEYPVGCLIIVDNTKPENMNEGDVISFYIDEKLTRVTHRIVMVDKEDKSFITKGDAVKINDFDPVYFENVIGKVCYKIPALGFFLIWTETLWGKIFVALIILFVFVITIPFKVLKNRKNSK